MIVRLASACVAGVLTMAALPAVASETLLDEACGSCHAKSDAGLSRISGQRKTPEGWLMTIVRMRNYHKVDISLEEQAELVTYLSETNGLAPSETDGLRYALERDPAAIETFEPPVADMCGRCHTGARVALQRRTAEEWLLHVDFHVGQFPTLEYQALGRDRQWYPIARDEVAPLLAERYPYQSDAWEAWKAADKSSPAGEWIVLTTLPGKGEAYGRLELSGDASPFTVGGELRLADGSSLPVSGKVRLYTGYEWRASLEIDGERFRQVLRMSGDGSTIEGRQFLAATDSLGGRLRGVKAGSAATVLGTVPSAIAGSSARLQLVGTGLGEVSADGGTIARIEANDFGAAADLSASGNALITLSAGDSQTSVAAFESLDSIRVEPPFTIARVGGASEIGPGAVPAMFHAIGYWNGADGEPGTDDDIRVGEVGASWSVEPMNEIADAMKDVEFAGKMNAETGLFMPAIEGPNPERAFSTNNAGDLRVLATTASGLSGSAQLIVTVQRWVDPPIR